MLASDLCPELLIICLAWFWSKTVTAVALMQSVFLRQFTKQISKVFPWTTQAYFFQGVVCRTVYFRPPSPFCFGFCHREFKPRIQLGKIQFKTTYWAQWISWLLVNAWSKRITVWEESTAAMANVNLVPRLFPLRIEERVWVRGWANVCFVCWRKFLRPLRTRKKLYRKRIFLVALLALSRRSASTTFSNPDSCDVISGWWLVFAFPNFFNSVVTAKKVLFKEWNSLSAVMSIFFSHKK